MKIAIFGGTGGTGKYIVSKALADGHDVVALARTPAKLDAHPQLSIVQGSVVDADCVEEVVQGADVVISALAPPNNKPDYVISQGIEHILTAMQKHDVQRIVLTAGAGVEMPGDQPTFVSKFFAFLLRTFSRYVVEDMEQVVHKVVESDREYVIGRAPRLTNEPAKGHVNAGSVGDPKLGTSLSREDFAQFIYDQIDDDTWLNQAPALSN